MECPVCYNPFNEGMKLHCGHEFCLNCLSQWIEERGSEVSCPLCRGPLRPYERLQLLRILYSLEIPPENILYVSPLETRGLDGEPQGMRSQIPQETSRPLHSLSMWISPWMNLGLEGVKGTLRELHKISLPQFLFCVSVYHLLFSMVSH